MEIQGYAVGAGWVTSVEYLNNHNHLINVSDYFDYLHKCLLQNKGYVISPDIIWNIIILNISKYIKNNPKKFRSLFNGNEKNKKEIKLCATYGDIHNHIINIYRWKNELIKSINFDYTVFYLNEKNDDIIVLCNDAVFLEAGSPYYIYSGICGSQGLKQEEKYHNFYDVVIENKDGFINLIDKINLVNKVLLVDVKDKSFTTFMEKTINTVKDIIYNIDESGKSNFWQNIYSYDNIERNDKFISKTGWIFNFKYFDNDNYTTDFQTQYGKETDFIYYKNVCGIISAEIKDNFIIPYFNFKTLKLEKK